jgi:ribosomal protein S18 acetylase RimI-like enzyme
MLMELTRITPATAMQFKSARLAALQDSPAAFGSTYAREVKLADADWLSRSERWVGENAVGYLAMDAGQPVGLVVSHIDEHDRAKAHANSMWVSPTHRRQGVGRMLIDAITAWSRDNGAHWLYLMVTSSNHAAIKFYEQNGFTMTGRTQPYPNDVSLFEYEMRRLISRDSAGAY